MRYRNGDRNAPPLSPETWSIEVRLVVDGYGERWCTIGPLPTWAEVRDLAEAWESEHGSGTARVVSRSNGRMAALKIALKHPNLIRRSWLMG